MGTTGIVKTDMGGVVDAAINKRDTAQVDLIQSKMQLLELGVKTIEGDQIFHMPGLNLDRFMEWNRQEFSWEAEYEDGKVIRQFEKNGKQHHYGHIDQEKLVKFRWVSCFDYATANEDKRVIVEVDLKTGEFNLHNGSIDMSLKNFLWEDARSIRDSFKNPKLIMKMIRRESNTYSFPDGEHSSIALYNRYLIGYESSKESEAKFKRVLCIEPNGVTHFWE